MIEHAKSCYPQEACGFLAGKDGKISDFFPMENVEHSSISYLMDPKEQMRIFKKMRDDKTELLGIFHSHVASPATPSQKDRAMAFYTEVSYFIVSLADMQKPDLRSFRIADGKDAEEEIAVA